MLVLTRSANQSIMIGHDVVVTVLEVRGDQVRVGIKAPRSVDVHREEVYAALQRANKSAAVSSPGALAALSKLPRQASPKGSPEKKSKGVNPAGGPSEGATPTSEPKGKPHKI